MSNTPNIALDDKATRIIEQMIAVEARHIAQRQPPDAECGCKDGMFPTRASSNRRTFLFAAGSTAGAAAAAVLATPSRAADSKAPPGAEYFEVPPDPTKQLGRPVAGDGGYGSRSQFETEVRWRFPTANEYTSWSMTPLDKMLGNLTASGLHFERHHGGIPTIDPAKHVVFVHGMVDQAKQFTLRRSQAISVSDPQVFHRMLRQWLDRVEQTDAEDRAGHTWPC